MAATVATKPLAYQAKPTSLSDRRLSALDGLRGLAILMVMFWHFTIHQPSAPGPYLFRVALAGNWGVDLFFVLSGFLITGILLDSKGTPNYCLRFYSRRALRIFPPYYALLLGLFVLHYHTGTSWLWFVTYSSNIAFAREGAHSGFLNVTWSLAIEEQFYLIWPWVVLMTGADRLKRLCRAMIFAAPVLRCMLWRLGFSPFQVLVLLPCRMDTLAIGALLAVAFRDGGLPKPALLGIGLRASVAVICLCLYEGWIPGANSAMFTAFGYSAIAIASACGLGMLLLPAEGRRPARALFESAPMRFFGRYSYGMYLLHCPAESLMQKVALPAFPDCQYAMVYYALALTSATAAALLSWRYIEAPMLRLRDRLPW